MIRSIDIPLLAVLLAAAPTVFGQQDDTDEAVPGQSVDVTEEIVVIGQSRARLRVQIELAEEAIYDRFNEINSTDDFDIRCTKEVRTGTNIPQRVCLANYWRDAQARAGTETTRAFQGSSSTFSPSLFRGEAAARTFAFEDELQLLAASDDQLLAAIVRLAELKESRRSIGDPDRRNSQTTSRVASASAQSLPYDAAVLADVRIQRDPWEHVLTHQTFAIAHVFGEIDSIRLNCADSSDELLFSEGAEWSVPNGWAPCFVRVEADRGTTFSFFEFE